MYVDTHTVQNILVTKLTPAVVERDERDGGFKKSGILENS